VAYLLKEGLRTVFAIACEQDTRAAVDALDRWLPGAQRCRINTFVDLGRRKRRHREAIANAIIERLSNGLIESTNTKTRSIPPLDSSSLRFRRSYEWPHSGLTNPRPRSGPYADR
jgi:transposase